jgi:hypothetical protein
VTSGYENECAPALDKCDEMGSGEDCSAVADTCYNTVRVCYRLASSISMTSME